MTMPASLTTPSPTPIMGKLMRVLAMTQERELSCVEVFTLVDYCIEMERAGENVQGLLPQVAHHLRLCAECADEYLALRRCLDAANETPPPG